MYITQGRFGSFVSFENNRGYGAFDTFDLHDLLLQNITELFYARSWNDRNNVKFAFDIINRLNAFESWKGVYNLRFLRWINKNVNWRLKPTVTINGLHYASLKQVDNQVAFELFWEPK